MHSEAIVDFVSGITGATASVYVGQPLDTIKVKLQTFPEQYKNVLDCGKKIFYQDGFRGYYIGTVPSLLANAAENGILFMAYGQCQNIVCLIRNKTERDKLNTIENMAAGSFASVFSSMALCPTELVKCRMQTLKEMEMKKSITVQTDLHKKISPFSIVKHILRVEGIRGLFCGLSTTLMRECPGYGCFFGGYELTRSILMNENQRKEDIGFLKTWIAGGMAGICFWILMFPVDSLKSRIQVFKPNMSFMKYTLEVLRKEGVLILYSGLFPTLIRTFLATGTLFITYEQTRLFLNHLSS